MCKEKIEYWCIFFKGQSTTPTSIPGRIVSLVVYLLAVIIYMSYSASLISSIMTRKHVLPFTDFEGFLEDGSYTLGAQQSSAELDFFKVIKIRQTCLQKFITYRKGIYRNLRIMGQYFNWFPLSFLKFFKSGKNIWK